MHLSMARIAARNASLCPRAPALRYLGQELDHAGLYQQARHLASALLRKGLKKGDRFSVLSQNNADFLLLYIAASASGLILNTVNFRLASAEMEWILADAEPSLLVFESEYAETVQRIRHHLPSIKHFVCIGDSAPAWAEAFASFIDSGSDEGPLPEVAEDDPCCLMYSSGTTGKPKGVVHDNRSMARVAEIISSEMNLCGDTRLLAIAPLFHMGAATLSLAAQFRGGCAVLHRGFDAEAVIRTIESERITAMHMVPMMVQAVLESPLLPKSDLGSLRALMYAAAPMPLPVLKKAMATFGPILFNGYGQTEINMLTLLHPHQHVLEGDQSQVRRLASVGQAHWQCELRIIDADGNPLPLGEIGEITARSETGMTGYWRNPQATAETLREGWIRTGDVGYLDKEGYLFLVDRKKDVIISGGENIYSREVEDVIAAHEAVQECAVIGLPDARWGEAVTAAVVLRQRGQIDGEALRVWTRERIAAFKVPKRIEFIEALPRLVTGKISKVELRKRFSDI